MNQLERRRRWAASAIVVLLICHQQTIQAQIKERPSRETEPAVRSPTPADENKTGTLTGRFRYVGRPPERQPIDVKMDAGVLGQYHIVDESLVVGEDRAVANVFIWVRSSDIPSPTTNKLEPITIEFKEGQFVPRAVVFQAPREVRGTVHESLAVNFFYQGKVSLFNVLCPAHDEIRQRVKAETAPVRLSDNIHSWARAWILPLAHPYGAVSDKDGSFEIENIPPGQWEFQVWHERTGNLQTKDWPDGRFTIEIKPGKNDLGEIKLPPALFRDARHADEQ